MNGNITLNYGDATIRVKLTKRGPEFNLCDLVEATGKRAEHLLHDLLSYIPEDIMREIFGISVPHLLASDATTRMYHSVAALDPEDKHHWFFAAMMILTLANTLALEDEDDAES